jgi:capsular exopolysaccharide synthesis family protein
MDLVSYFRVLKRRWWLIVICVVAGAVLGVASTMVGSGTAKSRTYYKATHTLIFDNSSTSSVPSTVNNLDQIAILVTTGDVPDAVAKKLGTTETGRQLAERIVTTTNGVTSTLDVTAAASTPHEATTLADAFAEQIGLSLTARDLTRYNQTADGLNKKLADFKAQADAFLAQLGQTPKRPDFDTIQKQYDATQNEYYQVYAELQQLTSEGAPASRLSTLETAQAQPIAASEYQARLSLGALAQNHLRADTTGTGSASSALAPGKDSLFKGKTSRGILGALIGFLVGVGLAVVADRLDRHLRSRMETEAAYGLPVLAEVPRFSRSQSRDNELIAFSEPHSRAAEAFRAVRTSLLFQHASGLGPDRPQPALSAEDVFEPQRRPGKPLVVMIASASPREGKTTTSANLAAVFAEAGASVLVINCDFRRPTIHKRFGVENYPRQVQDTPVRNLKIVTDVVADVNANPAEVVAAQRQVIAAARSRFDVIVLDTAPLLTANDAIDAVGSADLVVLVARVDMTTSDKAARCVEMLTRLEAPLGGVVLVATDDASSDYYYYYQRGREAAATQSQPPPAANGNANGTANGSTNGTANGSGTTDAPSRSTEMFRGGPPSEPPPG